MSIKTKSTVGYLVLKKIRIEYANAISGPITYGFPALTAFAGAVHAISRKLTELGDIELDGVLVAAHECEVLNYRDSAYADYTFNQTRNPIKKNGKTASIIEEGKCHLTVSLAIEVKSARRMKQRTKGLLIEQVGALIFRHRVAGGNVVKLDRYDSIRFIDMGDESAIKSLLIPGFVLMDATEDMNEITRQLKEANPQATELDALIEVASLHHIPNSEGGKVSWTAESAKTGRGWLVPMPIGYQGISSLYEAGEVENVRSKEYKCQFVESICGLGKWVFPFRIDDISQAFWRYSYIADDSLYLLTQSGD